jgi:hypothetical protein
MKNHLKTIAVVATALSPFVFAPKTHAAPPPPMAFAYASIQGANGWVNGEVTGIQFGGDEWFGEDPSPSGWIIVTPGHNTLSWKQKLNWTGSTPTSIIKFYGQCIVAGGTSLIGQTASSSSKIWGNPYSTTGMQNSGSVSGPGNLLADGMPTNSYYEDTGWSLFTYSVSSAFPNVNVTQVSFDVSLVVDAS